jgi:aspartate--ammonia ligase
MNAIRRDETMDRLHSIYVDQWDWEKVIDAESRNIDTLRETVRKIVHSIAITKNSVTREYPQLKLPICEDVCFITSEELRRAYPGLTPKERENTIARERGTVFVMQIGGLMSDGTKHDGRAPDYDDWKLNGDLLFWYEPLSLALEISSMGIRVDPPALIDQLEAAGCTDRATLPFHQALLSNELPLTIGGGIGQSRLCMMLLEKIHVGEVQAYVWNDRVQEECKNEGVQLL